MQGKKEVQQQEQQQADWFGETSDDVIGQDNERRWVRGGGTLLKTNGSRWRTEDLQMDGRCFADGSLQGELSTALVNRWDASRTPHGSIRSGDGDRDWGQARSRWLCAGDASGAVHGAGRIRRGNLTGF